MTLDEVSTWVCGNFKLGDVRRNRALAEMVWGLLHSAVVGFAAIGRNMVSLSAAASQVTRIYKFCHNKYVDPHAVQAALVALLAGHARYFICGLRLVAVAIDWHSYDNGRISGLRVSLVTGTRALPLLWYEIETVKLKGQRSAMEQQAIRDLTTFRPPGVRWLILLDAGFRSPDLVKLLDSAGYYILRSQSASLFHSAAGCWTAVGELPIAVGQVVEFGWGYLTKCNPLLVRLVGSRIHDAKPPKPGLRRPRRQHNYTKPGLCVVATNLPADTFPAVVVIRLYARRFEIEHSFRDLKNATYGSDMEHVHLREAQTYERLLCIVAVAEALSWLVGTEAETLDLEREFTPSRPRDARRVLSLRTIGRLCLRLVDRSIESLIREHVADAIAGVINVTGRTWRPCRQILRLQGADLDRSNLSGLPPGCQIGQQHRRPPCTPALTTIATTDTRDPFYPATRAAEQRCIHA